jgi:plasmid replication initiation protein
MSDNCKGVSMEKNVAKKSNRLVESRHKLNTHQQRLFLLFVSKIRATDKPEKIYELKRTELAEISKGYLDTTDKIKEVLEAMLTKTIDLSTGTTFVKATYFSRVEYDETAQVARVEVHSSIQQELFDLCEKFALINLECTLNLDSRYYISLYELLRSNEFKGRNGKGVEIDLDQLKGVLGCDDVKTYDPWTNFKRYILDKAQVALQKHTDTKFTYKPVKTGRKVTAINFFIEKNEKWQSTVRAFEKRNSATAKQLRLDLNPGSRKFAREGDKLLIGDTECIVGPSGTQYKGHTLPIGQLTTMLKEGKATFVEES